MRLLTIKRLAANQAGFIPLLLLILAVAVIIIVLAYLRVAHSH